MDRDLLFRITEAELAKVTAEYGMCFTTKISGSKDGIFVSSNMTDGINGTGSCIFVIDEEDKHMQVDWLYVRKDLRGREIGSAIAERLEDIAKKIGSPYMELMPWTEKAERFWVEKRDFKPREDGYLIKKL